MLYLALGELESSQTPTSQNVQCGGVPAHVVVPSDVLAKDETNVLAKARENCRHSTFRYHFYFPDGQEGQATAWCFRGCFLCCWGHSTVVEWEEKALCDHSDEMGSEDRRGCGDGGKRHSLSLCV
ncbi:hypothetical protein AX16_008349 [Volvariella volvacea WC 439]|nr:hypothetical protein AX16_008349 [Volvariella volvacea WC 439]